MALKSWRIELGKFYIRRRDQKLVEVTGNAHMRVEYILKETGAKFAVTTNGFRMGFRPATEEEMSDQSVL
jgi:1-aminocyclopropane-1-carboxylate deaminase/D-cysteine desulfhydrase-like pyridoxal-dependent ACC family enzyme